MRRDQGKDLHLQAIAVQRKSRRRGPGRIQSLIVAVRTRIEQYTERLTRVSKEIMEEGEVEGNSGG